MEAYALVFDADYYYNAYTDLQTSIGKDSLKLFEHFYSNGMDEGRRGNEGFSPAIYKENNPDLAEAYGDNWRSYYEHYRQSGQTEGRVHN